MAGGHYLISIVINNENSDYPLFHIPRPRLPDSEYWVTGFS